MYIVQYNGRLNLKTDLQKKKKEEKMNYVCRGCEKI